MFQAKDMSRLRDIAEQASRNNGCILYDLLISNHVKNRRLQVFIDREEEAQTPSIDDCERVSKALSLLLDVEDVIEGERYDLEVSTPGLERTLTQDWHFQKAIGQNVKIKTNKVISPLNLPKLRVKTLTGELIEADKELIVVENERGRWEIERSFIHKVHVLFLLDKNPKKNFNKTRKK